MTDTNRVDFLRKFIRSADVWLDSDTKETLLKEAVAELESLVNPSSVVDWRFCYEERVVLHQEELERANSLESDVAALQKLLDQARVKNNDEWVQAMEKGEAILDKVSKERDIARAERDAIQADYDVGSGALNEMMRERDEAREKIKWLKARSLIPLLKASKDDNAELRTELEAAKADAAAKAEGWCGAEDDLEKERDCTRVAEAKVEALESTTYVDARRWKEKAQAAERTLHRWRTVGNPYSRAEAAEVKLAEVRKALALAQSMILGGEQMSEQSEKIFCNVFLNPTDDANTDGDGGL